MKLLLTGIVSAVVGFSGFFAAPIAQNIIVGATPAITVPQGGTGWGNIQSGTYLTGNGTGRLSTSTCAQITGSADLCDGNDASGAGSSAFEIATTTDIAVSQLGYFTKTAGRTTLASAPTTTLTATSPLSLSQTISVIGSAASALSIDTSGAWAGTAAALAANGANCSAGSAPLGVDAAGAVENCFDVWTEAENTSAGYATRSSFSATTPIMYNSATGAFTWVGLATTSQPASSNLLVSNGSAGVYGVATSSATINSPLSGTLIVLGSGNSLSIANAAADGSTKGAASFTAADFDASSGNISIDYTNGQAASGSAKGFLTSADWTTFNSKNGWAWPFPNNATSTGLGLYASTTIGTGAQDAGLTVSGGATTTGNAYFAGTVGIGTTTPARTLSVQGNGLVSGTFTAGNLIATNTLAAIGTVSFPSYTSSLLVTGVGGVIAEYTGSSCTNQFPRSQDALGNWTCATVGTADVSGLDISDDTNLSATWPVILTGDALSFGGLSTSTAAVQGNIPYFSGVNTFANVATGTVSAGTGISLNSLVRSVVGGALQIAIDLAANFAWTGAHDFGGASALEIPNGTAPTTDATGEISWDTTSGQLKIFDGSANRVLSNGYLYPAFTYSTTTWTGTTTIPLGTAFVAETWAGIQCFTDAGTLQVSFNDGTNRMNWMNASTTVGTVALTTNNTFTAAEKRYADVGTPASSPTKISCTVQKAITAD